MLERQDIGCGIELAVNLHECVLIAVQAEEGVMFGKHLDNDLCTIGVSGTCNLQKSRTSQTRAIITQTIMPPIGSYPTPTKLIGQLEWRGWLQRCYRDLLQGFSNFKESKTR